MHTEAYFKYIELYKQLIALDDCDKPDTAEGDVLRDQMDPLWRQLNIDDIKNLPNAIATLRYI